MPTRKDLTLRILELFYNLIEGDHVWAERRSILIWTAVIAFLLMGRATEQITDWWVLQPYIDAFPGPVVFALSLVHPQTLRHALPPLAGFTLALGMAANYVRDLFELADLETGQRYLNSAMFGSGYPAINIRGNGFEQAEKEWGMGNRRTEMDTNPIPKIGGPGYVNVSPGSVALFEHVGGPSKVAGAGWHFIRRFETLREVVDLRDQFRERAEVKAVTKDGIEVTVQNVQVSFRVRTSNRPRTQKEAFPFSISAVKRIAYGKTVSAKGPSNWADSVPNAVVGTIRNYISRNLLDDLISRREGEPGKDDQDPRTKIKALFNHKDTRKRFADMGVELLWVSLGHIKTPQDVMDERINAWGATWKGESLKQQAEGDAHKLRAMEAVKAFARLDIINDMLKGVPLSATNTPNFDLILIQFAEALSHTQRRSGGRDFGSSYSNYGSGYGSSSLGSSSSFNLSDSDLNLLRDPSAARALERMGFWYDDKDNKDTPSGPSSPLTDKPPPIIKLD
jgi:regulator of protease activity HflC (stomatin/prohibitin superfamily)